MQKAKARDKPIFLERINCFTGTAKRILDTAHARLNVVQQYPITAEMIQTELEQAHLADFIFCPSPLVKDSFLEANIPAEKLLLASYGWSTQRFPGLQDQPPASSSPIDRPFTIVFVGRVCVRKGAHLLIEAFVKSKVRGRLILCGEMEPVIAEACKDWLASPNIIHQPYTSNITAFYRQADVFAFPSLEEGSPLVSYEAMAHGLPMLVSPMGAGEIVRDGIEGLVLQPYDIESWVEAIRLLATFPDRRLKLGYASWQRAADFTFDQVANRRARQMLQHL
jgi:glycosyltransferase involved in cell wall biosynthesis